MIKSVPERPDNICKIFEEYGEWFKSAKKASMRWGIPIPVMMAIIYHESGFRADAKPPRGRCCLIFPGLRPSNAYGYPQALDSTWDQYRQYTGNRFASRSNFDDAIDFVGWYCYISHTQCKISVDDAYNLYIAYHEGHRGYLRQTYLDKKPWLRQVARSVERQAQLYANQLKICEKNF